MRVYAICLCIFSVSLFGCNGDSDSDTAQQQIVSQTELANDQLSETSNDNNPATDQSDESNSNELPVSNDNEINIGSSDTSGCVIQGVAVNTIASQVECDALITLYNSLDGPNWNDTFTNWNTATDPCEWYRIVCNDEGVNSLSLHSYQLTGEIPAEIGNLSNLQFINLSLNSLTGTIPPELG